MCNIRIRRAICHNSTSTVIAVTLAVWIASEVIFLIGDHEYVGYDAFLAVKPRYLAALSDSHLSPTETVGKREWRACGDANSQGSVRQALPWHCWPRHRPWRPMAISSTVSAPRPRVWAASPSPCRRTRFRSCPIRRRGPSSGIALMAAWRSSSPIAAQALGVMRPGPTHGSVAMAAIRSCCPKSAMCGRCRTGLRSASPSAAMAG